MELGVDDIRSCDDDLWDVVLALEPAPRTTVSDAGLLRALAALGDYADLKLPERSGYARRISRIADAVLDIADLDASEEETLVRAARVHDVGMVAVPVGVWRARPRPGSAGWEQVRLHPHWSARILARCSGLDQVATVVGRHHERLDGSGYPSGLTGDLGRASGLLGCAVLFDEMTSMPPVGSQPDVQDVATEMARLASVGALDRGDVNTVLAAVGAAVPLMEVERPAGLDRAGGRRARPARGGSTNRQIAAALDISPKTVASHVEHIYTKAGVRSRAAATLFAMQHNLVG